MRVGTQGLFRLYLKTFVAPFLPARLTSPGSPRMPQSALRHGYCLLQIHDSAVPELKSVSFVKTIWLELNDKLFGINKQKKLSDGDAPHFFNLGSASNEVFTVSSSTLFFFTHITIPFPMFLICSTIS